MTIERELTSPVEIALDDGRLNRAAIGWSRTPLHRCNLRGSFARKKRGFNPPLSGWLDDDLAPRLPGLGERLAHLSAGML